MRSPVPPAAKRSAASHSSCHSHVRLELKRCFVYEARARRAAVGCDSGLHHGGAAVLAAAAAAAGGLVLAGGSSGPGVNVAAAAYAATSTGGRVLEAQFVDRVFIRVFDRSRAPVTFHRREWIDTNTESPRTRRVFQAYIRRTRTMTFESATAPGRVEFWNGTEGAPSVIHRFDIATGPRAHHGTGAPHAAGTVACASQHGPPPSSSALAALDL